MGRAWRTPTTISILFVAGSLVLWSDRIDERRSELTPEHRMILAVADGDVDGVRKAVEQGAPGELALAMAAAGGKDDVIRMLLARGVDPNEPAEGRCPPLTNAAGMGHGSSVELLLKAGADPNAGSPLVLAAESCAADARLIKLLVAVGADVNRPDRSGLTPLQAAISAERTDLAVLLRELGARR